MTFLNRHRITALVQWTLLCVPVSAQVSFKPFPVVDASITSISADGSVVVGVYVRNPTQAFGWTAAGGIQNIGGDLDTVKVSRDGKTIAGSERDSQGIRNAAIWQSGTNWKLLGGVPGGAPQDKTLSAAYDVSGDGSVIVGIAYQGLGKYVTFRWDAVNGMVNLGALGDGSRASAVSADGNVILGFDCSTKPFAIPGNCRRGFVHWYGSERLLHPYGWAGEALATNSVGSIMVGNFPPANSYSSFGGFTTYMYTAWDGRFEDLGAVWQGPPGMNTLQYQSAPSGVSDDGSVVVGNTGSSLRFAFLWTRGTGMVNVQDFLTSNGVTNHAGWILTYTTYVSPDGKTIAGVGINPDQIIQSWIVTLR